MEVFASIGATLGQLLKMNETWSALFLQQHFGISAAQLAQAKEYDKDIVGQMFQFLLGAALSFHIPKEWKYQAVAMNHMNRKIQKLVDRVTLLKGKAVLDDESGKVAWELGIYSVKLGADRGIAKAVHRPTSDEADVPAGEGLDSSWGIKSNLSDFGATFVRGRHQAIPCHVY